MKQVDIIGSYWTIAGGAYPHTDHEYTVFDFKDRVEALTQAGFTGMGLWHADLERILQKYSLEEMKSIFDDNGIQHIELEFLIDWFLDDPVRKAESDRMRALLMEAAEVLDARHIKVGDFFNEPIHMDHLIECFSKLCDEAAERNTKILYEFMPFANVHCLEDALTLMRGADRQNGGVILDIWHMVLMNITNDMLSTFPSKYILGVELNDGKIPMQEDLLDATINKRLLCGEGDFDIGGFLKVVADIGYEGPFGIEVLNSELREMPLDTIVTKVFETTSALLRDS